MTTRRREALAARRMEMGYTQDTLARKLGVAESTVRRWELGATDPRLSLWSDIADALHLPLDALRQLLYPPQDSILPNASNVNDFSATHAETAMTHVRPSSNRLRLPVGSAGQLDELLTYLRDQWHALVRADNLLGPRFALGAVKDQIALVEELLPVAGNRYGEVAALGGAYAESAAWLHEDAGQMPAAMHWVRRAMEWAIEAEDDSLLAWTIFRRSQHTSADGDAQRTVSLTRAASRGNDRLPDPMRAAIAQQEAQGHALAGDEITSHRMFDEAQRWATLDTVGDARGGHGSFCTETYIELQRANCWTLLGKPQRAIQAYETSLPHLPAVYRRDRGMACSRFAKAYLAAGEPEAAAEMGQQALAVARSAGSGRTENDIRQLAEGLEPHRNTHQVEYFFAELAMAPTS
jgi:DNA-binding XRE family transcriptional regulator